MKKLNILLSLLAVFCISASAQYGKQIPMDAKIRYGKLDNGLTYYIRHNEEPKQRAEFFIAQNVGAILENDDQNGLAHFLEHMAFNGTKNYPGKGIINYMEKIGVKFGRNVNAYTSLDETVYNLSDVPTIRTTILDSALLVLHDWSSFISLEGSEIDAERGVIREEWRQGANANRRMWKESNRLKYPGSQYAKRDVIGDTAIINNFSHQTLRDYYKKWYRPDLQAILVVGDINVDEVEAKIKKIFADIPKPVNPAKRVVYGVPDNKEPIVAIVTDAEAQGTQFSIEFKKPAQTDEYIQSEMGYYHSLINTLISIVVGERFDEMALQPDAPFVNGGAGYRSLTKANDAFTVRIMPKAGKESEGLTALFQETERIKRFGFTKAELERAKTSMLKSMESLYNDREHVRNNNLVREYVRNFLDAEPIPGIETEYAMQKEMLPRITAEEVNKMAASYITDDNVIITILGPEKESVKIPAKDEALAALQASKTAALTAKAEEEMTKKLMETTPKPGTVKKTTKNTLLGTTEMLLGNGIKVIFKPTAFKKDEILLSAYSNGGLSKVKNVSDVFSGTFAATIVDNNGLGNYSSTELRKILTGKVANVSPYISEYEEGLSGSSSVADLETMLQLAYLYFTAPRKDDNAFQAMKNMYKTAMANSEKNPSKAMKDSINVMLSNRDPRTVIMNADKVDQMNQDKALEIYKQRFANPADFTFVLLGNIDPADKHTQNLINTYLGGLKTTSVKEKWDNVRRDSPKGKVNNIFARDMKVKKTSNFIYYAGNMPYNMKTITTMDAIGNILSMRYLESIREKEGGSYGVGVRGGVNNTPKNKAALYMQFDTDPEKEDKLLAIIHQEIQEIIKNGPKTDDLDKVKENMLKQYAEDVAQNGWWKSKIKQYDQDKINYVADYKTAVNALTPQLIRQTLKSLVDQGNVLQVVMNPTK